MMGSGMGGTLNVFLWADFWHVCQRHDMSATFSWILGQWNLESVSLVGSSLLSSEMSCDRSLVRDSKDSFLITDKED